MKITQQDTFDQYSSELTLSRKSHLQGTIVIVDGFGRTGKGMLGTILSSFDRIEIERIEYVLEWVSVLYRMGKISYDASVWVLQTEADNLLINSMAGRNTNFRYADQSSAWKAPSALRYFRRIFIRDKDSITSYIEKSHPIFQFQTHAQLSNFNLYHDAFGNRLKFIELIRHPVDVMDAWMRRGFGIRFGNDPLQLTMCVEYLGSEVPYIALGWKDIYINATPLERIVRMVESMWDLSISTYESLSENMTEQIFFVSFEEFVQNPRPYLHRLASFVGSNVTRHTQGILRRENCPRTLSITDRDKKQRQFEDELSHEYTHKIHRLIHEYEEMSARFIL